MQRCANIILFQSDAEKRSHMLHMLPHSTPSSALDRMHARQRALRPVEAFGPGRLAQSSRPLMAAAALVAVCFAGIAPAQAQGAEPAANVVQLSAQAQVEVAQDVLRMTLSATRQGAQAALVQTQLKSDLEAALKQARKSESPGQMEVRTGNFSLYPRYDKDGRISSWQGTAELVLEGKDIPRITSVAGDIGGLTVSNVSFGLSAEQRAGVEGGAQKQAIQNFRAKAAAITQAFGFKDYSLREVSVNTSDEGAMPVPRMMAMASKRMDQESEPVPVAPGKSRVTVSISGSVQMH